MKISPSFRYGVLVFGKNPDHHLPKKTHHGEEPATNQAEEEDEKPQLSPVLYHYDPAGLYVPGLRHVYYGSRRDPSALCSSSTRLLWPVLRSSRLPGFRVGTKCEETAGGTSVGTAAPLGALRQRLPAEERLKFLQFLIFKN